MAVEPFDQLLVGDRLRQSIYVALGAVVLVLLIACANITNLLLAQGAARRQEMAVRAALGASRGRIAAQLLVETLVLGLLGGVAGVGLAAAAGPRRGAAAAADAVHRRGHARLARAGLRRAHRAGRLGAGRDPAGAARGHGIGGGRAQHRRARLVRRARARPAAPSSPPRSRSRSCSSAARSCSPRACCGCSRSTSARGSTTWSRCRSTCSWDRLSERHRAAAFYPRLVERVRAIPGVVSASVSGDVPLEGTGGENLRMPGSEERLLVRFKRADAAYFGTLGIPVVDGRGFTRRGSGRRAVRRGGQRGAGPAPGRSVRPGRPGGRRRSICRPSASAAIAGSP